MIDNKQSVIALFMVLSIFTMIGCGGSVAPQSKAIPPAPEAAAVFVGNQNVSMIDAGIHAQALSIGIAFSQTGSNVTGRAIPQTSSFDEHSLMSCIDLDNLTVTGTVQGSSFALILTDPQKVAINVSGTVSPLTGTYNINFPATCPSTSLSGTITFQKMGG